MDDRALDLMRELRAIGFHLRPGDDGNTIIIHPASKLTPARRQAIRENKRALLAVLDAERIALEAIHRAATGKVPR